MGAVSIGSQDSAVAIGAVSLCNTAESMPVVGIIGAGQHWIVTAHSGVGAGQQVGTATGGHAMTVAGGGQAGATWQAAALAGRAGKHEALCPRPRFSNIHPAIAGLTLSTADRQTTIVQRQIWPTSRTWRMVSFITGKLLVGRCPENLRVRW